MAKKTMKKNKRDDRELSRSFDVIKQDILKLKKDIHNAYLLTREEAKKQVQRKLVD